MSIDEKIELMVSRIVERFRPHRVILFGSHARGEAHPESDIDLLVVMPVTGSRRARQIEIRLALRDIRGAKDIVIVTPEEMERHRNIVGTVVEPALREGKVLYDRAS
jgi:predicted nucleotidyltransferase